jgi:hypothetical protein
MKRALAVPGEDDRAIGADFLQELVERGQHVAIG